MANARPLAMVRLALVALPLLAACSKGAAGAASAESAATGDAGAFAGRFAAQDTTAMPDTTWTALFDGTPASLAANWRGYRQPGVPGGWQVEDSLLTFVPGGGNGDLITRDSTFGDFELALEWRLSPGGNSGIMYRVAESQKAPYETGPEMQVLDNARHADGRNPLTSAGANYGLDAPASDVTRPVGEWNQARVVARGDAVEHWLNGQRVVAYALGSPEWKAKVAASKFAAWPEYGTHRRGHLVLQDHGNRVWFRDVRVRRLGAR